MLLHDEWFERERDERLPHYPELQRMICRAVSNEWFAHQLITTPLLAVERLSEHGHYLSPFEQEIVTSITGAVDIYDFAARLYEKLLRLGNASPQSDVAVSVVLEGADIAYLAGM